MSGNKTRASVMRKFTGLIPPGSEEKLAADVGRIKHILQEGTFSCPSPRDTHTHTLGCRSLAKAPKTHPFWCQPSTQLKPPQIWEYPPWASCSLYAFLRLWLRPFSCPSKVCRGQQSSQPLSQASPCSCILQGLFPTFSLRQWTSAAQQSDGPGPTRALTLGSDTPRKASDSQTLAVL